MIKVLLIETLSPRVVELLREIPEFEIVDKTNIDALSLKEDIRNCDAVLVGSECQLRKGILENAKNLKLIVKVGVGMENIDLEYARSETIEVRQTPFATPITVAEYTLALMLGVCRFIGPSFKSMKDHNWTRGEFTEGIELYGKTSGIIGFGRVGKEVAKRLAAMGMRVVFHDIVALESEPEIQQVPLEKLLEISDFISLHLPLTETTRNLISAKELDLMKDNSVLIVVSPLGVLDRNALLRTLKDNKLKAAAINISNGDIESNRDLIDNDRVYPFPDLAAATVEGRERAGTYAVSILKDFFNV